MDVEIENVTEPKEELEESETERNRTEAKRLDQDQHAGDAHLDPTSSIKIDHKQVSVVEDGCADVSAKRKSKGKIRMQISSYFGKICLRVSGMFVLLSILVWLDELIDIPHLLFGAPQTPINWQEAIIEMILVFAVGIIAVSRIAKDITERKLAEKRLLRENERTKILLELYLKALQLTDKELYDYVLEKTVSLTDSTLGFFHKVSDDQKTIILTTWNKEALKNCTAAYDTHYSIDNAGNWIDCVRYKRPVVYNAFHNSPNQKGFPEGHSPMKRFMSIPIMEGEKVRFIFGVGNKPEDYDEHDVNQIRLVANELHKIITRRQIEEALRKSHQELMKKAAELESANEDLSQYAYIVSHDIKAPLRAIHNYTDFLKEDLEATLDGDQKEYLDNLGKAVKQAEKLVEDLLWLSRTGRREIELEKINLKSFFPELIQSINIPDNAEIKLSDNLPTIKTEPILFKQIFQNLIGNAAKFNNSKQKNIEIECELSDDNGYRFYVRDNGFGIEPRFHEKIFGTFQRLHTDREFKGTGIGLAIVKKAVSKLGGTVEVESEPGKGSTFIVTLPQSTKEVELCLLESLSRS